MSANTSKKFPTHSKTKRNNFRDLLLSVNIKFSFSLDRGPLESSDEHVLLVAGWYYSMTEWTSQVSCLPNTSVRFGKQVTQISRGSLEKILPQNGSTVPKFCNNPEVLKNTFIAVSVPSPVYAFKKAF